ncbi:MAG: hypothetical protein KGZ41_08265 [Dethiobacter sp.]|jgi:hypothetical protein|nr:hypothetical protein [Dethiobacter sp.]
MTALLCRIIFSTVSGAIMKNFSKLNIRVLHAMPGRIRLQCNTWKSETIADGLADSLRRNGLVDRISVSPITGSLLIHFTQKHLERSQFDEFMDLVVRQTKAGIELEASSATRLMSRVVTGLDSRVKVVTKGLFDLPSLFVVALTTQAVKGFGGNRGNSLQQLFWVYRLLRGGRHVV